MMNFYHFYGTVTMINNYITNNSEFEGCRKIMTVDNGHGSTVNFVISPNTYFVNHETVSIGDKVTGYYDGNAPAILIFPPQYPALIMVKENLNANVKIDYFNSQLESSDGQLKLNISPYSQITLINDQTFSGKITNRNLIVIYGQTTKSIPAQTTPYKIIVWC